MKDIKKAFPEEGSFNELADFFKVFGDNTRIKIIFLLGKSEMCVNEISTFLDLHQPACSHQLRILKNARLVKQRRDGKSIYYSLDDDHVRDIITRGFEHIMERYKGTPNG